MNIVLFLGAGFSRAFDLPVMDEFFVRVNQSTDIKEDDKKFIRSFRERARSGISMLNGPHDNLEHVLSFALMLPKTQQPSENGIDDADRLRLILQRVYSRLDPSCYQSLRERMIRLLRLKQDRWDHDLTVITTNYDLIAEFGLHSIGMSPVLPIEWQDFVESESSADTSLYQTADRSDRSSATLCKLHGSVNWFRGSDNESEIQIEGRVVPIYSPIERERLGSLPMISTSSYFDDNEPLAPLIIPPTLYKQEAAQQFQQMWDTAHEALKRAHKVAFIGYSFPSSDTHMKYFLASALVNNIDLGSIDLLDPKAERIVQRLGDSNFGSHFKDLLKPFPFAWEKGGYSIV